MWQLSEVIYTLERLLVMKLIYIFTPSLSTAWRHQLRMQSLNSALTCWHGLVPLGAVKIHRPKESTPTNNIEQPEVWFSDIHHQDIKMDIGQLYLTVLSYLDWKMTENKLHLWLWVWCNYFTWSCGWRTQTGSAVSNIPIHIVHQHLNSKDNNLEVIQRSHQRGS